MTDLVGRWLGRLLSLGVPAAEVALFVGPLVGTSGPPCGSKPGAILRNASRFRRSFSSSRERKYPSRRAVCAANVVRLEDSRVTICGSRVNG